MKKQLFYAIAAAAAFVSCSTDDVVNEAAAGKMGETPIGFNVQKENITRAQNLETQKHYNFGVWAWKVNEKNGLEDQEVMNHYLVGWNGEVEIPGQTAKVKKGYHVGTLTTTYGEVGTTKNHLSPWFYEGLGTEEYTYVGTDGYYTKNDADYMSKNNNQYLRYWDLAYNKTNFYCYAPYNKTVTFAHGTGTTNSFMTFPATTSIRDGYDEPLNSAYANYSRTLGEYMYATKVQATNAALADVNVGFKHMGAQLFIRFYEDIPGYKVEMIDLAADKATVPTEDKMKGIQATPAIAPVSGTTYENGTYYTTSGATIEFTEDDAAATYTPKWDGSTTATNTTPLMFKIPTENLTTQDVAKANLTDYTGLGTTVHKIIKEKVSSGTQEFSYSPTIYYPVAQPTENNKNGLTFHVSYRIIAEDNKEVITVHNATVHVPYKGTAKIGTEEKTDQWITVWQPNVRYTYTFKITRNSTGYTNPEKDIDPTDPTPSTTKALYPIVFDNATIEDYTDNASEYSISEGTNY